MIYHDFKNLKLSALGLGCMRLPLAGEKDSDVDEAAAAQMVEYALQQGINYFDTAWMYHGGESESVMGRILSQYPRESFYLATKFPGYCLENIQNHVDIFETQLRRLQTEYFDFYLCHNVTQRNIDMFLDPRYGVVDYLIQQKKAGRIRHLGFSTHGSLDVIRRFLDACGEHMEFCQIQLNYMDWNFQNAKAKVDLLNQYRIPIWVMEPVRGGRLAALDEESTAKLKVLRPDASVPEWAFRFLQGVKGVTMTLSGMSNQQQLMENIRIYETVQPLNQKETDTLLSIADEMIRSKDIPCTACSYCVEKCPQGIIIPNIIKSYNEAAEPESPGPADCLGCRSCEAVCPQGIMISEIMEKFAQKLR